MLGTIDYLNSCSGKHIDDVENKSVLRRVALEIRRFSTLVNQVGFEHSRSIASWTVFTK